MKPIKISQRNIMFSQPMSNYLLNMSLILGENRNYLIDTGLGSGSVAPVLEYLKGSKKPLILINTHCHWDHIWGNWVFKENIIISHKLCYELMDKHWSEAIEAYKDRIDGEAHKCLPNLTTENGLCFADDNITIFHTPGHSPDSISIYDGVDKVLHAGDEIGDTDENIVPFISTNAETFQNTINIFKQIDFNTVLSGHNSPKTKDILAIMEANLQTSWEKQVAEHGLPPFYK